MIHKLFITLLSVSAITVASPLQEKLRVVATQTAEIKDNIRSGAYFTYKNCESSKCSRCNRCSHDT